MTGLTAAGHSTKQAVLKALEDNAPNACTISQLIVESSLGETTVRTAIKQLTTEGTVIGTKNGTKTTYRVSPAQAPPAPVQPEVPEPPTSKTKANAKSAAKQRTPRREPLPGARREAAQARDAAVLAHITEHGGFHRRDLADAMEVDYDLLYISLWRLERDNIIIKARDGSRSPVWRLRTAEDGKAS